MIWERELNAKNAQFLIVRLSQKTALQGLFKRI